MKALVVYESLWGNTGRIGRAIAEGLATRITAEAASTRDVDPKSVADVDLLVVGGPTHVKGLSRWGTYFVARRIIGGKYGTRPDPAARRVGSWLRSLKRGTTRVAAFDTRREGEDAGAAAPLILERLEGKGYVRAAEPEGFIVEGMAGPLAEGEVERARAWGRRLADSLD